MGNGYLDSGADWYIIRYANVLLMYAEALNEANNGPTQEAYDALSMIRERADIGTVSGLDYTSFQANVWEQQRLESPFEGTRWFNLLRTDRALTVMNSKVSTPGSGTTVGISAPIEQFMLLYPIPLIVVTTSDPAIDTERWIQLRYKIKRFTMLKSIKYVLVAAISILLLPDSYVLQVKNIDEHLVFIDYPDFPDGHSTWDDIRLQLRNTIKYLLV